MKSFGKEIDDILEQGMQTKDYDYQLPLNLIAQQPAADRTQARLMLVSRATGAIEHHHVADLPALLHPDDLMIVNDTRVIPARVFGHMPKTGGKVEVLLVEEFEPDLWKVLLRSSRRPDLGETILLAGGEIKARVRSVDDRGFVFLEIRCDGNLPNILSEKGFPPLPPYIKRKQNTDSDETRRQRQLDQDRYQTVYARDPGAIAAPTAGLHLSAALIDRIKGRGVQLAAVTLHVGPGTFLPVRCDAVEEHKMESERYTIGLQAAQMINQAVKAEKRIVAVGTTVARTLETAAGEGGLVEARSGRTELFVYPPYRFRVVRALLTNFHLPRSTLLMLVSAFAGRELILQAYKTAVEMQYRFYSYGDCMLIV